jgi:4-amino-4-deoxy-L-arabinose transferase-like glycosyltransferase
MLRNRLKFNYTFERIIFILLIVIQFVFLDASPVYILDESKFAQAAREMLVTGNYWIPTFNGSLFVDKPPMQYFFMMFGFKIFGINAFGARFFSALLGCLTVFITYKFSHDYFGRKSARAALFVMVSAFFFMQQFQLAAPDPYLIFFCSAGLFSFFRFYKTQKSLHLILFYLVLGLGVLSKGPVALALPGLAVGLFLIFRGELKRVFLYQPVTGLLGVLLISLP